MPRSLADGQRCRIHVLDVDTGEQRMVHESDQVLYEAPNWTADGAWLIINGDGHCSVSLPPAASRSGSISGICRR